MGSEVPTATAPPLRPLPPPPWPSCSFKASALLWGRGTQQLTPASSLLCAASHRHALVSSPFRLAGCLRTPGPSVQGCGQPWVKSCGEAVPSPWNATGESTSPPSAELPEQRQARRHPGNEGARALAAQGPLGDTGGKAVKRRGLCPSSWTSQGIQRGEAETTRGVQG